MGYRDNYQAWLRDFAADAQAVAELKAIEGDEKEIEDRFYRNLSFGTAGMRGVLAMGMNRMNVYTVRRATQGLADFLSANEESRRRGVVIAYDSRRMSREFAEETALVLCANGVHVYPVRRAAARAHSELRRAPFARGGGRGHHRQPQSAPV